MLVEAVPNFSEGRDRAAIDAIAAALEAGGATVLPVDPNADAHRTVVTLAGDLTDVVAGLFAGVAEAIARIDLRSHAGAHLRVGAADVVPIVPLLPAADSEAACVAAVRALGERLADELDLPIYFYERSALRRPYRALPRCRRGGYEALRDRWRDPDDRPDRGPQAWSESVARTGATVLGVRDVLVAMNFTLDSRDEALAKRIARAIRAAGPAGRPHRLPAVRAVGWTMPGYAGRVQVSTNLLDVRVTSAWEALQAIEGRAAEEGARVLGAELIGLTPARVLAGAFAAASGTAPPDESDDAILDAQAADEVEALVGGAGALRLGHLGGGMDTVDIQSRVLECALRSAGLWSG